jgi:DNA-binding transcriptional LysR family regulator
MADIDQTKIRQLDFTLLLVMRALLRHRRTTVVAEELNLSQSAISHALARLRRLFGDPLFLRRPHGLEPTRHALALGPRIDALLREADDALGSAASFHEKTARRDFRIAAPDHLGALLAAPLLKAFQRAAPHARFALRVALGREALESLRRDEIDLALGQFQQSLHEFRVKLLYTDRYCLVARVKHPEIEGVVTKALFERLDHVAISIAGDFRAFTDEDLRDLGLRRNVIATAPRFSTAFDMISQTNAVAIAPSRLARAYAAAFKLKLYDVPIAMRPLRVLAARRAVPDLGIDWLTNTVLGCLRGDADR